MCAYADARAGAPRATVDERSAPPKAPEAYLDTFLPRAAYSRTQECLAVGQIGTRHNEAPRPKWGGRQIERAQGYEQ